MANHSPVGTSDRFPALDKFDAKGTEHTVRFSGFFVEKHQHSDGWTAFVDDRGLLGIRHALPTEYLSRLDDHNEFFGDQIRIIGLTRANRFVTIQPTLRGGEPSENEIRDLLQESGWQPFQWLSRICQPRSWELHGGMNLKIGY
jgi:hypothetical protein